MQSECQHERETEWQFHEYYSSLIKQNINMFIALEWRRICRYRAVTDQINALQAKITLSLINEKFHLCFGTSCILCFCPVVCFSMLRQHLLWRTASTPQLFGVFQLLVLRRNWCFNAGCRSQALPEGSEHSYQCYWVFPGLFWAPFLCSSSLPKAVGVTSKYQQCSKSLLSFQCSSLMAFI